MNPLFSSRTIARLARAWALIALLPIVLAPLFLAPMMQAQDSQTLNKHARKVYKTLSKYDAGAFLHLEMQNGSDLYGRLGTLEGASFRFVDSDNNATETIAYDNVDRVRHNAQTVSERDYPRPHRHLLPLLLIGAAAGAGAAVYFTYIH